MTALGSEFPLPKLVLAGSFQHRKTARIQHIARRPRPSPIGSTRIAVQNPVMLTFDLQRLSPDEVGAYMWSGLRMRKDPLSASNLLDFAIADLKDGDVAASASPRHLVNALSNAKKALHLRLEDVCLGFGCGSLKSVKSFPKLIAYARNCGVVAPRVLERLNSRRNMVEHEFDVPKKEDVENFVDVVQLFLAATDRWEPRMPVEVEYYGTAAASNGSLLRGLRFDWTRGAVTLEFKAAGASITVPPDVLTFESPSEEFFQCVRLALEHDG